MSESTSKSKLLDALQSLHVAELSREEWITVGMSLKEEGFPCETWDAWSRNDVRYKPGECAEKWETFRGDPDPVTGGTIIDMARKRGWTPQQTWQNDGCLDWDDIIEYDGDTPQMREPQEWSQTQDLIRYLDALFDPDDHIGYVTNDVFMSADGRWAPSKGVYDRTAGELIESLKRHPEDIGATVGDWKEEVGGWIRFNSLDGKGVKNENVTKFRYALVESDTLPIEQQYDVYRKFELPIAALVHSGGKSLHAIVHIDAANKAEYRQRVDTLYSFLEKSGVPIDKQNSNPSRLSRMPGLTRNGNKQYLIATNIGRKTWADWIDFTEGNTDELPAISTLAAYSADPPTLPEELIEGVLRRGHKMLISGPSKAGKSFLLIELCIAIAEGTKWLSLQCKKGRVLYVNLEIDEASVINRFLRIYDALGIDASPHMGDILMWNLRGHAVPMDELVPKLVRRVKDLNLDAIIIDPIYKVITGDENNASDMGKFCNQFDRICSETGCSVIYCHHHSKGAQGAKRAMDRASGSGVFARDPDAQLDIIELELSDDIKNNVRDGYATAWRMESSLREFENIQPIDFWFEYPIHCVDQSDTLKEAYALGSPLANLTKSPYRTTQEKRAKDIDNAYDAQKNGDKFPSVKDIMDYIGIKSDKTARKWILETNRYNIQNGVVIRKEDVENDMPE